MDHKEIYRDHRKAIEDFAISLTQKKGAKNLEVATMIKSYLDSMDNIIHLLTLNNIGLRAEVKAHEDSLTQLIKDGFRDKDEIMKSYLKILNDFKEPNKKLAIG